MNHAHVHVHGRTWCRGAWRMAERRLTTSAGRSECACRRECFTGDIRRDGPGRRVRQASGESFSSSPSSSTPASKKKAGAETAYSRCGTLASQAGWSRSRRGWQRGKRLGRCSGALAIWSYWKRYEPVFRKRLPGGAAAGGWRGAPCFCRPPSIGRAHHGLPRHATCGRQRRQRRPAG